MKVLKSLSAIVIAAALVVPALPVSAYSDQYNDFVVEGEFPETGTLIDWNFGYTLPGLYPSNLVEGTESGTYMATFSPSNSGMIMLRPRASWNAGSASFGIWNGAHEITTGAVSMSAKVRVPSADTTATFARYFQIWSESAPDTNGILMSVFGTNGNAYLGFNTNYNAICIQVPESDYGEVIPIEKGKWYTMKALLDYDKGTIDFYLDGEYIASSKYPPNRVRDLYKFRNFDIANIDKAAADDNVELNISKLRIERYKTDLGVSIGTIADGFMDVCFDKPLPANTVFDADDLTISSGETPVNISSLEVLDDNKTVRVYTDTQISKNSTIMITLNRPLTFSEDDGAFVTSVEAGKTYSLAVKAEGKVYIDQDFDEITTFPTSQAESLDFDDFYCIWGAEGNATVGFENDAFIDAKEYYDHNKGIDGTYAGNYKRYTWNVAELGSDGSGGQAANLYMYRYKDGNGTWIASDEVPNKSHAVIFPFDEGKQLTGGKVAMEFDLGKFGTYSGSSPKMSFTVGLHDANNKVTAFNYKTAWTDSTALFGIGDYYPATANINKPSGRGGTYTYYWWQARYGDASHVPTANTTMWPSLSDATNNVSHSNEKWHMRVELDMGTKTYDIYKDGALIGDDLPLAETENEPCFDGFVIAIADIAGRTPTDHFVYLDNLKISEIPFEIQAIKASSDGESFEDVTDTVKEGKDLYIYFDSSVYDAKVEVNGTELEASLDFTMSDNYIMIPGMYFTEGNNKVKITDVVSLDGRTLEEFNIGFALETEPEGWDISVTDIPGGKRMTLAVNDSVYNNQDYVMLLAAYNEAGVLTDVAVSEEGLNGTKQRLDAKGQAFTDAAVLRAFVLSDLAEMVPLCEKKEF